MDDRGVDEAVSFVQRSNLKSIEWWVRSNDEIDIAILDSIQQPKREHQILEVLDDGVELDFSIRDNDCTEVSDGPYNEHGEEVYNVLAICSPAKSTFHFYKVTEMGGLLDERCLIKALNKVLEDNIDLVNISVGKPFKKEEEDQGSGMSRQIRRVLDAGIPVIAAAGNESDVNPEDGDVDTVFYPARINGVVSVGGFQSNCSQDDRCRNLQYSYNIDGAQCGPCCGKQIAMDSRCNGQDEWWEGNVTPTKEDPITTAPIFSPRFKEDTNELVLNQGTSFSAPLVTGQLAQVLCEFKPNVSQQLLFEAVKITSNQNNEDYSRFSAMKCMDYIWRKSQNT